MTYIGRACESLDSKKKSDHSSKDHYCKHFNLIQFISTIWIFYFYMMEKTAENLNGILSLEKDLNPLLVVEDFSKN